MERALTSSLAALADDYGLAWRNHSEAGGKTVSELVDLIKSAARIRNVLCHGSWQKPDSNGASVPKFVNRHLEKFETAVDVAYLRQVRAHVAELSCNVIDSVTRLGCQFPGLAGSGNRI